MTDTKRCPKCGETKPRSAFSRDTSKPDGLQSYCKACNSRYRTANPEKHRASVARWKARNPERVSAHNARHQQKHWTERDIIDARSRGPVMGLTPEYLESIQTGQCACCGFIPSDFRRLHLDRVDPAQPYQPGNVAYLCRVCNVRKSNLNPWDLLSRFERDFAAGKDMAMHDLLLHLYIRRQKRTDGRPPRGPIINPASIAIRAHTATVAGPN